MSRDSSRNTFLLRLGIGIFWLIALASFLYFPALMHVLYKERSLTIFTWPSILDSRYLTAFEKETGIKLHITYYESNQELFGKLQASRGVGYDVIMPTDYTVEMLIKEKLIKKLDRSKLFFFNRLNRHLLGAYCDPTNDYSLPYFWGIYGIGINRKMIDSTTMPTSWKLIFDSQVAPRGIGMSDESREAVLMAAYYLFGTIDIAYNKEQIAAIKKLLIEQKSWVEAYSETRSEYLLTSESCPVALALSPDIYKIKAEYLHIDFIVPEEGSFIFVDSIVVSAASDKDEMIYQFINYLYNQEVLEHHRKKFGFCSPVYEEVPLIPQGFCPSDEQLAHLHYFKDVIPQSVVNDIWITIMSR